MSTPSLYFLDIAGDALHDFTKNGRDGRVLSGGFNGEPLRVVTRGDVLPDGIVIHSKTNQIFWSSMGIPSTHQGYITACSLDGTNRRVIIPPGGGLYVPKQLAIDEERDKLYICDREGLSIVRCDLDGSKMETLVSTGDKSQEAHRNNATNWCTGVAIDVARGQLYWSQKGPSKGGKGRIFRAGLEIPEGQNASNRKDIELLFENLPEVVHLDIDPASMQLYWTDRGEVPFGNSINRAYVGPNKAEHLVGASHLERYLGYQVLVTFLHEAIGLRLDIAGGHIYAADMGGSIYRFNLDGTARTKAYEYMGVYTGITLV